MSRDNIYTLMNVTTIVIFENLHIWSIRFKEKKFRVWWSFIETSFVLYWWNYACSKSSINPPAPTGKQWHNSTTKEDKWKEKRKKSLEEEPFSFFLGLSPLFVASFRLASFHNIKMWKCGLLVMLFRLCFSSRFQIYNLHGNEATKASQT